LKTLGRYPSVSLAAARIEPGASLRSIKLGRL
jgi:hypothetical protein